MFDDNQIGTLQFTIVNFKIMVDMAIVILSLISIKEVCGAGLRKTHLPEKKSGERIAVIHFL